MQCLRERGWSWGKGFAFHGRPSTLFYFVIDGEDSLILDNEKKNLLLRTLSFLELGTIPMFLLGYLSTPWAWRTGCGADGEWAVF